MVLEIEIVSHNSKMAGRHCHLGVPHCTLTRNSEEGGYSSESHRLRSYRFPPELETYLSTSHSRRYGWHEQCCRERSGLVERELVWYEYEYCGVDRQWWPIKPTPLRCHVAIGEPSTFAFTPHTDELQPPHHSQQRYYHHIHWSIHSPKLVSLEALAPSRITHLTSSAGTHPRNRIATRNLVVG